MKSIKIIVTFLIVSLIFSTFFIMVFKAWSYKKMTKALLSNSVEQIELLPTDLSNYLVLDTRGKEEYEISHLQGAVYVDPNSTVFENEILNSKKPILVYCSVGLRSEKIGNRLQNLNQKLSIYNLSGGIFQWFNDKKPVVDSNSQITENIHTYNKVWSIWVTRGNKIN